MTTPTTSLEQVVAQLLARQQEAMEKQHQLMERLITATQHVSSTPATPAPSIGAPGPEAVMDILAKNIREFFYEPDENQIFATWYDRYEDVFLVEAENLDDAAKVRLLLRKVSTSVFNKYKDYILPKQPRDVTFQETVELLTKLFGRKESQFNIRVKCMQNVRGENEDIVSYAANVNRHCENFSLAQCTADNFKCLMFVNGLKSQKDQEIKARLLTLLDSETERANLTLDNLVAEIQRVNSLKRDVALTNISNPVVHAVEDSKHFQNKQMPRRLCWQCGNMHFVKDCKYTDHKCKQCSKIGHKEGFCACFPENSKHHQQQNNKKKNGKFNKTRNSTKSVYTTKTNFRNRRFVSMCVNNVNVKLQHDTGSDVTIMSKEMWIKIGKPKLNTSKHTPRDASTNTINIIGEFEGMVVINKSTQICNILVSAIPDLNLFGSDLIQKFNLWSIPVDAYTSCKTIQVKTLTVTDIRKMFPEVFRDEIGHVTEFKVHLELKPNAVPAFRPKRQVAYAVKEPLDNELDKLQREGIISPINFSEWAAPIVVVKKTSGSLRICGDYSTGLNSQLEAHNFPLPLPEDIFTNFNNCSSFSIIDLNNAYMQLEVDDETKKLLVINTHRGLYTFNRLAQGVKSAPGAFQQAIQTILSGIEGAYPYLDDVVVATHTRQDNENVVMQVLERLKTYNITVNFQKCTFFKSSCNYLGYYIDSKGIHPDTNKIKTILELSPPKNIGELRSYLGGVIYFPGQYHGVRSSRQAGTNHDNNATYIPYNNVPMGVTHHMGRLFITMPRRRVGIPSTLNFIDLHKDGEKTSPKLIAYPDFETNQFMANSNRLVSVYRTTVDSCERLWFIDTGMLEYPNNRMQIQRPSIWILDLNTDRVIRRYNIPESVVSEGRGLASLTIDTDKGCDQSFAYLPDLVNNQLYVYSFGADTMWSFQHNYFNFDPLAGDFNIGGLSFSWDDGIFSATLGPKTKDGSRSVFFHAMASNNEFVVSNQVLQNEANSQRSDHGRDFRLMGSRGQDRQSTIHEYDPRTGVIFYGEIQRNAVGCWNGKKSFIPANQGTIAQDAERMIYPSDLTIDKDGTMWIMTNSMPIFIYSTLDPNVFNFRVWKQNTATAVADTACA